MSLPLGLMLFALSSMVWSHTYLAGVETIRWFLFIAILFLGANSITKTGVTSIAWGVHLGAVIASIWVALQFWFDFQFFAQGPNPASTFVNRNFYAEYLVCTIPFSVLLLTRVRDKGTVFLLTFSIAFNIVALLMTGTRSALIALMLLTILMPFLLYVFQPPGARLRWKIWEIILLFCVLVGTVLWMSSIPTQNAKLIGEFGSKGSLTRSFTRAASLTQNSEYTNGSFSIRTTMWRETQRMIYEHPFTGIGAGAWEVEVPRFQESSKELETDYYAHNEILQLIAEYGVIGWLFLVGLLIYAIKATLLTWVNRHTENADEGLLRALTLASLLALLVVSNAGFPWRLATTGILFSLCLAILIASDHRLLSIKTKLNRSQRASPIAKIIVLSLLAAISTVAVYISLQAIDCESKLVRAIRLAVTISRSNNPNDLRWMESKAELLKLTREGIAINPHYRKLTPIIADSLARWGDWRNAIWIWESVLNSRPHIVGLLSNLTRANIQLGEYAKAQEYLNRVKELRPNAIHMRILQVMLWSRTGQLSQASYGAKSLLAEGCKDRDLLQTAYVLGMQTKDMSLTIQALEIGREVWPERAVDSWLKLGEIYATGNFKDEELALHSYESALKAVEPEYHQVVLDRIPTHYQQKLRQWSSNASTR